MADLIPNCTWEEFKEIIESGKLHDLQSCEVKVGEHTFTALIPHGDMFASDYVRTQSEYLGQKSNITGGISPAELLSVPAPEQTVTKDWFHMNKAEREAYQKAKQEAVTT